MPVLQPGCLGQASGSPLACNGLSKLVGGASPCLCGCTFLSPPSVTLTTDASLLGWGAHLSILMIQGRWTASETSLHINMLVLRAVRNTCLHILPFIRDKTVRMDNISCMFYINKQGGTRSPSLCTEVIKLWNWCITSYIQGYVPWIPCGR